MYNNTRHIYLQDYLDNGNSANILTLINVFQSTDKTVNKNLLKLSIKLLK